MFLESVVGTVVGFLFQRIVDSAKSVDDQKALNKALSNSTSCALKVFSKKYPLLSDSLFDQTFVDHHLGKEISKLLTRDKNPDSEFIANGYKSYFQADVPEINNAVEEFISLLESEMAKHANLQALIDSRQLDYLRSNMATKDDIERIVGNKSDGNIAEATMPKGSLADQKHSASELRGVFGREKEIEIITKALSHKFAITLYGMSGIGKTTVVNEVRLAPKFIDGGYISLRIYEETSLGDLYRQLAPVLGCRDENPVIPIKLFGKFHFGELIKFAKKGKPCLIHLTYAQNLFDGKGFKGEGIKEFFLAIAKHAPQARCIFESRVLPPTNILPSADHESVKVQGLDLNSMHKYFQNPLGGTPGKGWVLSDNEALTIYRRLGGNECAGNMAHPFGMFLLATVADCHNESPIQALERHSEVLQDELEEALFRDLYDNALGSEERRILRICALYREWIPDEHVEELETTCDKEGAFGAILRRCLLTPDDREERYFLHSLISDFVHRRIDHSGDENIENHECIAEAWALPLKVTKRSNLRTIKAASEAAYHFVHAECFERLKELVDRRLLSDLVPYFESYSSKLHREHRIGDNRHVLELLVAIDPDDHKSHRFLGESLEKLYGEGQDRALFHYERAHELRPDYPPYLANVGRNLLAQNKPDEFISIVDGLPQNIKKMVLNDYNHAIYARCLTATSRDAEASDYRKQLMGRGSRHIAFFTDEALHLSKKDMYNDALALLDRAEKFNINDPVLTSIRTIILEQSGDSSGASKIRQDLIKQRTKNVSVYVDETLYLKKYGKAEEALCLIEKAIMEIGLEDRLLSTKATILDDLGDVESASKIRKRRIFEESRHVDFYRDEARCLFRRGFPKEALSIINKALSFAQRDEKIAALQVNILDELERFDEALTVLARLNKRGTSSDFLLVTEAKILEKVGRGREASAIRQALIEADTLDPVAYNNEASYLLAKGQKKIAMEVIDRAERLKLSNSYLLAIKAKILEAMGQGIVASGIRRELMSAGTDNPAIYSDEAIYLSNLNKYDEAFETLDLGEKRGLANDYSRAIRSQILDLKGSSDMASEMRENVMEAGTKNPVFYNDQAVSLRKQKMYDLALQVLDSAEKIGAINDYSVAIRAGILQDIGKGESASELRQAQIENGAKHPAIFNDEAVYQRNRGSLTRALEILGKCEELGLMDYKLRSTKKSIEERM